MLDSLITSLTKHTSLLSPAIPQASIAFGADEMSCMATETMFELANRYCPLLLCSPALPCLLLTWPLQGFYAALSIIAEPEGASQVAQLQRWVWDPGLIPMSASAAPFASSEASLQG